MTDSGGRSPSWVLADGSASISGSALIAAIINASPSLAGVWGLAFLHELTKKEDGVIIVASLLLLPSTFIIYGVANVIFAAKEAVEKKAMEKGRQEGRHEGRHEGRQEGREEGREEGRQEGRQEGREEGLQEGLHEGLQEGLHKGQNTERERIERELEALEKSGVSVPPEVGRIIARESVPRS